MKRRVSRPFPSLNGGYKIEIKENGKVVETLSYESRETAWQAYYGVKREIGTGL